MNEEIEEIVYNDNSINEINIIIADDEMKTCEEIKEILSNYCQIKILGIANTDEEEIRLIEELKPDIVVTDLMRKRRFTGLDIIRDYEKKEESPKFIIVSFAPEEDVYYRYENIADYVHKYPKINGEELANKIIYAKRTILEEKEIKKSEKKFWEKVKEILFK